MLRFKFCFTSNFWIDMIMLYMQSYDAYFILSISFTHTSCKTVSAGAGSKLNHCEIIMIILFILLNFHFVLEINAKQFANIEQA